jgi:hypothetical protein
MCIEEFKGGSHMKTMRMVALAALIIGAGVWSTVAWWGWKKGTGYFTLKFNAVHFAAMTAALLAGWTAVRAKE